jgi:hypothetical protein
MKLPVNYVHIDPATAVHVSTIRRFTTDVKALMKYLAIANQYDFSSDPDAFMEVTVKSGASTADVIDRMREHGEMMIAISGFMQGGDWHSDEPEPVLLRGEI